MKRRLDSGNMKVGDEGIGSVWVGEQRMWR